MKRKHCVPGFLSEKRISAVKVRKVSPTMCQEHDADYMRKFFQKVDGDMVELEMQDGKSAVPAAQKVGVVFCGRQAPGCHDILCGLVDMMKSSANGKVLGFVGGTKGLFEKQSVEITPEIIKGYAGTGGLEL